jgi:hypothetical protein
MNAMALTAGFSSPPVESAEDADAAIGRPQLAGGGVGVEEPPPPLNMGDAPLIPLLLTLRTLPSR